MKQVDIHKAKWITPIWSDYRFKMHIQLQPSLIKVIVKKIKGKNVSNVTVINSEATVLYEKEKQMYYDLKCQDEDECFYIIEMQNGEWSDALANRFLGYVISTILNQVHVTDKYKWNDVSCIVFLNSKKAMKDELITHYTVANDKTVYRGDNLHLYIVNIPYIDILYQEKGLKEMDTFERFVYAIRTNFDEELTKLNDEEMNRMSELQTKFFEGSLSGFSFADALRREIDRREAIRKEAEMERITKESEKHKQESEKHKQESEKYKQESEKHKKESEQYKQQIKHAVTVLMEDFHLTYEEALTKLKFE